MYRTFNMGLGMVLMVDAAQLDKVRAHLLAQGERPVVIGRVERGARKVRYVGGRKP